MVIAEIELRQIAVQMLLGAVLVDALHAALKDGIVSLYGVGADDAIAFVTDVLLVGVFDGLVAGKAAADLGIPRRFVSHQPGLARDVGANDWPQRRNRGAVHMKAAGGAAALDKGEHDVAQPLVLAAHLARRAFHLPGQSFVDFDDTSQATHRRELAISHGLADAVAKEPSRFIGHIKRTMHLMRGDTLFAGAHQINCLQHLVQRNAPVLENGSDLDGELLPTSVALPYAAAVLLALQLGCCSDRTTMRADGVALPEHAFKVLEGGGFIVKVGLGQHGHGGTPA